MAQTLINSIPRTMTYQGLLLDNGTPPPNGTFVQLDFYFGDAAGTMLYHQSEQGVVLNGGVFNVLLGDPTQGGFPAAMTFNEQYAMTIVVNGTTTMPAQLLYSAPYALNTDRVGGLEVSPTPVNGDLFPIPLNTLGKIDTSMLPVIPDNLLQNAPIQTMNGTVEPDGVGNVDITSGNGITVTTDAATNTVTINGPVGAGITGVSGQNGITGGGTSGNIALGIAPAGITSTMLASSLTIGGSSSNSPSLTVLSAEANGNEALLVNGGIGAATLLARQMERA